MSKNVAVKMIVFLLTFLIFLPLPSEGPLVPPSQADFYVGGDGKIVVIGEIGNPYPGRQPVRFSDVKAYVMDANYTTLYSEEDPFYTKFNLPYYAKLPVRMEMNLVDGVERAHVAGESFAGGIDKPADLIILSKNLEQLQSHNDFTSWRIEIELLNNGTKASTETYVMVSLRDSEDNVIGAVVNRSGLTIESKESKHIVLEEALPTNRQVKSAYVYAESKESTTYYQGMFPLRQRITMRAESGDYLPATVSVEDKVLIRNDIFNFIRSEVTFVQLTKIVKVIDLDIPINERTNWITAEIIAKESTIKPSTNSTTYVTWSPSEDGWYIIESFVWSDLRHPVALDRAYIGISPYLDTTVLVRSSRA